MYLLSSWRRWDVFVDDRNGIKYAIKKAKDETKKWAIQKEIAILKFLKWKVDFVPQIENYWDNFFEYKFIEWQTLDKIKNPDKIIYKQLVEYAFLLDKLNVEHGELSKPTKNIIIWENNKVSIIDFERWNLMNKTWKNLKWLSQFLLREKIITIEDIKKLIEIENLEEKKDFLLMKIFDYTIPMSDIY